jgi:hypothetical protein
MSDKNIVGTVYVSGQAVQKIGVFYRIGKVGRFGIPEGILQGYGILVCDLGTESNFNLLNGRKHQHPQFPVKTVEVQNILKSRTSL